MRKGGYSSADSDSMPISGRMEIFMSVIIDIIIAVIIVIPVILGIKRGFVRSAMKLVSVILAILAANILMPYISPFCREKIIVPYVSEPVNAYVSSAVGDSVGSVGDTGTENISAVADKIKNVCGTFGIDISDITDMLESSVSDSALESADKITESVTGYIVGEITNKASDILAFLLAFVGSLIVLGIVTFIINAICKMPVLNGINRTAGALFGFCCGGIAAIVIAKLLMAFMPTLTSLYPDVFSGAADKSLFLNMLAGK